MFAVGAMHQRKASPPRPTLLVGDLDACHRAYDDLKTRVTLHLAETPAAPQAAWQDMVPRFRALRESIVHLGVDGVFSRQAYELAADTCWRAKDWGEYLKCVQQLLSSIYPRFYPQVFHQATKVQLDVEGAGSSRTAEQLSLQEGQLGRFPEFTCAHILYFSCIVAKPEAFEVTTLLCRMPPRLVQLPSVQFALKASACLFRCDFPEFLRLAQAPAKPMIRQLLVAQENRARCEVMLALAASYRMLPPSAAIRMLRLQLPPGEPAQQQAGNGVDSGREGEATLIATLKAAAACGSKGASQALSGVQSNAFDEAGGGGSAAIPTLVFK